MIAILYCGTSIVIGVIAWIVIALAVEAVPFLVIAVFLLPTFVRCFLPGISVNSREIFSSVAKPMAIGVYIFLVIGGALIAILGLSVPWPISAPRPENATGAVNEINLFMQNTMVASAFMFAFFLSLVEKSVIDLRRETLFEILMYFLGVGGVYVYIVYAFQDNLRLFVFGVPVFQLLFDSCVATIASGGFAAATRLLSIRLLRS